ncbi:MAG: PleD family two-component system response regulator [Pseudanabaena sp. SU_2_4]|nr:PleD family two-component system response regulator [Pseudanabaena sp. SU_2_4]
MKHNTLERTFERDMSLVLLVDDDPLIGMQLRYYMEMEGYTVVEASNGQDGLDIYTKLHPDLVLLDALMPVLNGFEFCTKLAEYTVTERVPILMLSSLEDRESVDRAFAAGVADYVTKPFQWAILRQQVRHAIEQAQLLKKLEEANQRLEQLAILDGLTQVANRRRFDEYLAQSWRCMSRERSPLSLIMLDVDFFKSYNDTYGHQAGDACLKKIARAISDTVHRPFDLVARYGGEEFVVVLPNTPLAGATQVAAQIHKKVKDLDIPHRGSAIADRVTLSLGISGVVPHPEIVPESLLIEADRALYQAKKEGAIAVLSAPHYCPEQNYIQFLKK